MARGPLFLELLGARVARAFKHVQLRYIAAAQPFELGLIFSLQGRNSLHLGIQSSRLFNPVGPELPRARRTEKPLSANRLYCAWGLLPTPEVTRARGPRRAPSAPSE